MGTVLMLIVVATVVMVVAAEEQPSLGAQLLEAAGMGHVARTKALLQQGAPVTHVNEYGETALHTACIGGVTAVLEALLAAPGAPINKRATAPSSLRMTPLHWCAAHGHEAGCALLLDAGARITMQCDTGRHDGRLLTALDLALEAGRAGVATMLTARGGERSREMAKRDNDDLEETLNWERQEL